MKSWSIGEGGCLKRMGNVGRNKFLQVVPELAKKTWQKIIVEKVEAGTTINSYSCRSYNEMYGEGIRCI